MKEIWIDNYSISETAPGHYCISKNGTPCVYLSEPRGLSKLDMKQVLLNYIQGTTEIKVGDSDEIMKASEDYPNVILYMESLMENYEQLKDNWNKLKEWLEEESKLKGTETAYLYYGRVIDKMQEIKGDKNV